MLPTCRQEATPYLLSSAPSRAHLPRLALPCPAIPCSAPFGGALLRDGPVGLHPASLASRDSRDLWGSVFWSCDPKGAHGPLGCLNRREWEGATPLHRALLVQWAAAYPHLTPTRGLLSRQIKHFINCILNTCFKLV